MNESTARAERYNLQTVSAPAYTWEVADKPVCVRMPFNLIDRMEKEVVENFRSLTALGSEIGGILLGSTAPGNPSVVSVDDYEVIPCDYSRGPLYRLSDADMGRFERVIEQRLAGGAKVVGFFRSHTRKGLSLDAEDLSFFSARFREASHVALLVRPFATKASMAGIFIWENGAVQGETSYLEFPFRSSQLSPSRQGTSVIESSPAPANPAVSPAATAPPPAPAAPKPVVRAQIVPIASRREITLPVPPETPQPKTPEIKTPEIKTPETKPAENKAPEAKAKDQKPIEQKPVVKPATPAVSAAPAPAPAKEKEKQKEAEKPKDNKTFAAPAAAAAAAAPAPAKEKEKEKEKDQAKPKEQPKEQPKVKVQTQEKAAASAGGKTMLYGIVAAAALLLVTILFLYPGVLRHSGRTPAIANVDPSLVLHVERTGTDILLTWNRDSSIITKATGAVLTISDGERHENYDMDLGQLKNGSIVYSPLSADVSFRMEVTLQGGAKSASESVRVLRTRPSPMPDGSQPPADTSKNNNSKPNTPNAPNAPTPAAATDEQSTQEQPAAPAKNNTPAKVFNTASLGQRLRPANSSEVALPEAPTLNNTPTASPTSAPSFGSTLAPAPAAPAVPAPPAATPTPAPQQRASTSASTQGNSGGQIKQAQPIFTKQPEYPKLARQMGVKGSVEVLATIGTDGRVKAVKIEKGHPLLVKAATDAVMQWIYSPTLLNGTPVQNDTHITLNFLGDK
jgi:protein TonB